MRPRGRGGYGGREPPMERTGWVTHGGQWITRALSTARLSYPRRERISESGRSAPREADGVAVLCYKYTNTFTSGK